MDEYVTWNGNNEDEVGAFAQKTQFGFVVGSDYYNWRWYHKLYQKIQVAAIFTYKGNVRSPLPEWYPPEDATVLEIYPYRPIEDDDLDEDYTPWHWTTARVGDKIFGDGTVIRT